MTVFTARQLLLAGMSYSEMQRSKELTRFKWGAYRIGPPPSDPYAGHLSKLDGTDLMVDGVFSYATAALLHGLCAPYDALARIEIIRPLTGRHWSFRSRNVVVRLDELHESDVLQLNGRRVTSLARTIADVSRAWPTTWATAAGDMALRQGLDPKALDAQLEGRSGLKGSTRARWVRDHLDERAESPGESISRVYMVQAELPTPTLQRPIQIRGHRYLADFFLDGNGGVVGEFDGHAKYRLRSRGEDDPAAALIREKEREDDIRSCVGGFVRWGWADLKNPDGFIGQIARALGVRHVKLGDRPDY